MKVGNCDAVRQFCSEEKQTAETQRKLIYKSNYPFFANS